MVRFSLPTEALVGRGEEPLLLIRVDWPNVGTQYYADRDFGVWSGRVLSFSGISSQKARDNVSNVSHCSVKLDDFDSILKLTMDLTNPEGAFAYVYHFYNGDDASTRELFRGRITNFKWNEGTRECDFEIVSAIESRNVGFMVTDDFNLDPNNRIAFGKAWPLAFGKVAHIPAVFAQEIGRGKLKDHISLAPSQGNLYQLIGGSFSGIDPTDWAAGFEMITESNLSRVVDASIQVGTSELDDTPQFIVRDSIRFRRNTPIKLAIDGVIFLGQFNSSDLSDPEAYDTFTVQLTNVSKFQYVTCAERPLEVDDNDFDNPKVVWLAQSNIDLVNCHIYNTYTFVFKDPITGISNSSIAYYHNICVRQEGNKCWFKYPFFARSMTGSVQSTRNPEWGLVGAACTFQEVYGIPFNGLLLEVDELVTGIKEKLSSQWKQIRSDEKGTKSPFSPLLRQLDLVQFIKNSFWSASPGAKVIEWNPPTGDIYVANCFPSSTVHGVYAVRSDKKTGEKIFVQIPKSFYTVNLSRATTLPGVANCTTVEFTRALETFDLDWQTDTVYVTLTSTLSGNTATMLKWVFDTYTNYTTDGSFTSLSTVLDQYPANFVYLQSTNAIEFAKNVAWQARCGIILDASVAKLRYLSAEPTTDFNMDENSTEFATIELTSTPIDGLVTRLKGTYRESHNPLLDPLTLVYHNNIDYYGLREEEYEFFIYNNATLIRKTLLFWGYRYSNSWRLAELSGFNNLMNAEVFDTMQLDYTTGIIRGLGLKTVIESINFDSTGSRVTASLWLPSLPGETSIAEFAWLTEGLDEIYYNEADKIIESDVCIFHSFDNLDLAEVMRELRKLEMSTRSLGKIIGIDDDKPTLKQVLIMNNGPFEAPDPFQVFWMYDTSPHQDLKIGDFVQCQSGQDGISYIERYTMQPHLAKISAGTLGLNSYTAKLIRPNAGLTTPWPWLVEGVARGSEATASEQTITIVNLTEENAPVKGLLRIGDVIEITPYANDTLTANTDGFWYTKTSSRSAFDSKITATTPINGGIRWKYTIQLGHWDMATPPGTWVVDSGATVIYAYNSAEDMNTFLSGDGTIGTGNTADQTSGIVNDGACVLLALPVGGYFTVVPRGTSSGTAYFTIINAGNSAQ